MDKEYKVGDKYYLPVTISSIAPGYQYPIELMFVDCDGRDTTDTVRIADEPDLLLTAEEITEKRLGRAFSECYPTFEELKAKVAENANTISRLSANKVALTEEVGRLRETIADRTKDVHHYNEENDKLKTDVADLRAELESAREAVEQNSKDRDFYHARFDESAENLHKALTENAELKSRNEHLETLLKTKPIEEPTKTVHVVLNDGTGYNFLKCTKASFDNYADFSVLKIYMGEEYVAGFLRGDKPMNLAYWWTE